MAAVKDSSASIDTLKAQHAELEARLDAEERKHMPDDQAIAAIKRAKLRVKDQIAILSHA
jgi:hypothetical protein